MRTKYPKAGCFYMADSRIYEDWFRKARTDLDSAKILSEHGGDPSTVAFLSQQTIEKALKGFILKSSRQLKDGHSLIYLCRKANEYDDSFAAYFRDCAYVNQFYIETRYPADVPEELSAEDAERCLKIAESILSLSTR